MESAGKRVAKANARRRLPNVASWRNLKNRQTWFCFGINLLKNVAVSFLLDQGS